MHLMKYFLYLDVCFIFLRLPISHNFLSILVKGAFLENKSTFTYDPFFSPATYLLGFFHWSSFKEGTLNYGLLCTHDIFKRIALNEIVLLNLIKHFDISLWSYIITYFNFIGSLLFGLLWHNTTVTNNPNFLSFKKQLESC